MLEGATEWQAISHKGRNTITYRQYKNATFVEPDIWPSTVDYAILEGPAKASLPQQKVLNR